MSSEIPKPLSGFVRQQRKALKMTQQDLADRAGVGIRFIRELESGKPTLRMDKVNIVLDLFGHTLAPIAYQKLGE
ncbi:helix-turn-helix transcriptional regulator [uncultured Victivallis sp.]|uniref:helix-turn-helix transcriptional regulator n=1 Tax=uncultured Victivallis sp. TaxID=354118 RepID=UPI00258E147F|nr:helix-turn-helix transcriptional regulator [uncultured Victivallis sp.]